MKKIVSGILVIAFLVGLMSVSAFASAAITKDRYRLTADYITSNLSGNTVVIKMNSSVSKKYLNIEEDALKVIKNKGYSIRLETPKFTTTFKADTILNSKEWANAGKSLEPRSFQLYVSYGDITVVTDYFNEGLYASKGIKKYADMALNVEASVLVRDKEYAKLSSYGSSIPMTYTYGSGSIIYYGVSGDVNAYLYNSASKTWTSCPSTNDKSAGKISFKSSNTGIFTCLINTKATTDSPVTPTKPTSFTDISNHWAKDNILFMVEKGIVPISSTGKFNPNMDITRAEFCKFLVDTMAISDNYSDVSGFRDVSKNSYYYDSIMRAVKANIVLGVGDGKFNPTGNINRQEIAVMIGRALSYANIAVNDDIAAISMFSDNSQISSWAKDSVAKVVNSKLMGSRGNNQFVPKANTTRAEAIVILNRLYLIK